MIELMKDITHKEEAKRVLIEFIRGATEEEIKEITTIVDRRNRYKIESCRACGSKELMDIISFGNQHIIDFVESADKQSEKVPLDLVLCNKCKLLQLKHNAPNEAMWGGQYWYKSAINELIRENLKEIVNEAEKVINLKKDDIVIDIGCNDGTMLGYYDKEGIIPVGFEPSTNVADEAIQKGLKVFKNYFNAKDFKKEFGSKKAKIITAISMFYDLEDPNSFLRDITECLDPNGVFVVQQNYVVKMLENSNFDNVCHEHREYYSMFSFKNLLDKHNLEIFDLSLNEINGGSIRTLIRFKGNKDLNGFRGSIDRIAQIERKERNMKIDTPEPYLAFAKRAESLKKQMIDFVDNEIRKGKTFGICGASTRGNTILQYFGLDHKRMIAAADANPDKWGKKTVGGLIPIISIEEMQRINPDYQIVMIWHLFEGLMEKEKEYLKGGGKFILPLPEFKIVEIMDKDESSASPNNANIRKGESFANFEGKRNESGKFLEKGLESPSISINLDQPGYLGRRLKECRMCMSKNLYEFLDLGFMPPADGILSADEINHPEILFPLKVAQCVDCGLTQLVYVANPSLLYGEKYKYESSITSMGRQHFLETADSISSKLNLQKNSLIVDIGSNVGVLLSGFKKNGMRVLGIDPAPKIAKIANDGGIETWQKFISPLVAEEIVLKKGKAKAVTCTNVFAHIDDKVGLMRSVNTLLDDDGYLIIEAPYFVDLLEHLEYDTIYVDHLEYLSIKPLVKFFRRHEMEVFDVERYGIHGGAIRVFVSRKGKREVKESVKKLLDLEEERGIYNKKTLDDFSKKVKEHKGQFLNLLRDLKKMGKKIIGISAPAKGNTIMNYCKIDDHLIDYMTEKSTIKIGHYTPGMHVPIIGEESMYEEKNFPDYGIIFAWNFAPEIIKNNEKFIKRGGRFIIPIPQPTIVGGN